MKEVASTNNINSLEGFLSLKVRPYGVYMAFFNNLDERSVSALSLTNRNVREVTIEILKYLAKSLVVENKSRFSALAFNSLIPISNLRNTFFKVYFSDFINENNNINQQQTRIDDRNLLTNSTPLKQAQELILKRDFEGFSILVSTVQDSERKTLLQHAFDFMSEKKGYEDQQAIVLVMLNDCYSDIEPIPLRYTHISDKKREKKDSSKFEEIKSFISMNQLYKVTSEIHDLDIDDKFTAVSLMVDQFSKDFNNYGPNQRRSDANDIKRFISSLSFNEKAMNLIERFLQVLSSKSEQYPNVVTSLKERLTMIEAIQHGKGNAEQGKLDVLKNERMHGDRAIQIKEFISSVDLKTELNNEAKKNVLELLKKGLFIQAKEAIQKISSMDMRGELLEQGALILFKKKKNDLAFDFVNLMPLEENIGNLVLKFISNQEFAADIIYKSSDFIRKNIIPYLQEKYKADNNLMNNLAAVEVFLEEKR